MKTSTDRYDPEALLSVLDVARHLALPRDLLELLDIVVRAGRRILGADRGTVLLFDPRAGELYSTVGDERFRFSIDTGISGDAARRRRSEYVPDCSADPRFNPSVDQETGYQTRTILAVPLIGLEDELVGVMTLLNPSRGTWSEADLAIAEALASQAAVALQRALLLEERDEKRQLERDMEIAHDIQQGVMPARLPRCDGYSLAAVSRPAGQTGGDIYDAFPLDARAEGKSPLMLLLADASGHGIGPALSVTQFRAMVRMGLRLAAPLDQVLVHVNDQLINDLVDCRFITAFLGVLDPRRHQVHYFSPGQGPLLHYVAAEGRCRQLGPSSVPLGLVFTAHPEPAPPIDLAAGDALVLLTDGFFEYHNATGEQFGYRRAEELIHQLHTAPAQGLLDGLLEAIGAYSSEAQRDDITALIVKRSDGESDRATKRPSDQG